MSAVNVTNVTVLDNPSMFLNPFQFEISYECLAPLKDDLEWKLIYVGSAEDEKYDQVLESVLVGPVNVGNYRFVFQVLVAWPLACFVSGKILHVCANSSHCNFFY
jgi:histone chaperone ASF1